MMRVLRGYLVLVAAVATVCAADVPPGSAIIERDVYLDQLEGFWLAQCIANWTGLRTEGRRTVPPFYTDADWPVTFDGRNLFFVTNQDPWQADDDTDIEYVYAGLLHEHGSAELSAAQIRDGWIEHINRFIWVSNAEARDLMDRGLVPPATSLPSANPYYLRIDAQLTTEFFGALAPGMPARALELADLPIAVTARGHAAHASQYFVVLHALAAARGSSTLSPEGIEQLVIDARAYIPDSSKAADIVDTVLADYLANPDATDWERTRDLVAQRYQLDDDLHGFQYLHWTESSVNFGAAVVCLLYGQGDLKETIRIGTLTGWDSDNPTATMGGLVGLMLGADGVRAQFPDVTLSDRYWITRTRDNMPDYLPGDPEAEDTFSMLVSRMLGAVDDAVESEGGVVHACGWLIPPQAEPDPAIENPLVSLGLRSANNRVRAEGGTVAAATSLTTTPQTGAGSPLADRFANGNEDDPSGADVLNPAISKYFWSRGAEPDANGLIALTVTYSQPVEVHTVRFIEGDHFSDGGWFETPQIRLRVGGQWLTIFADPSEPLDPSVPFQIIDFILPAPLSADGIQIIGSAGGSARLITASELDALSTPVPRPSTGWDVNADDRTDVEDLYEFDDHPADFNGDGKADHEDFGILEQAVRWRELRSLVRPHP